MDETIPPWLDCSFLSKVLQSVEENKKFAKILKFWCQPALPPGSNYVSKLYRVGVDYKMEHAKEIKTTSLIVKIPLESGGMKEWMERSNCYEKEFKIYNDIFPRMYELHSLRITAKSFYCPLNNSLVLEDLKNSGYKMADRLEQLDFQHCRYFMLTLARLHALSVSACHKHPHLFQNIGTPLFFNKHIPLEEQRNMRDLSNNLLRAMVDAIAKLNDCKMYAKKIQGKIDTYWEKIGDLYEFKDGLNVLTHGDAWTTNLLYKYDDAGDVVDAKLVDFQLAQFCSFTFDIIFFWFSSASEEVREYHSETLFEIYRQTLNKLLKELGCVERLSKEEFNCQMRTFAPYSLFVMASVLPLVMAEPENLLDFNKLKTEDFSQEAPDDNAAQWKNYKSKYYKAILPSMLRHVERFGAFQ